MPRLVYLLQVSRPILWPVLPMVYFLGVHTAGVQVTAAAVLQMAMLTLPMNLIGCGLNDIYDVESDRRSSRRRVVWGAIVTGENRAAIWRACCMAGLLMLAVAAATGHWWNVVGTLLLIGTAWAYSVPPVRLKERPPLDSLANGVGYFLLPFAMGFSLGGDPLAMPLKYWLLAICVCGIHALATAADYEADRAVRHRTFAVAFGRRGAAAFAAATFLVALAVGGYRSTAVDVFLAIGAVATIASAAVPRDRVIGVSCVVIFVGFLVAAICHVVGW